MNFDKWLEQTIKILKIRLNNLNLSTEELMVLIEYAYEKVLLDTYVSKKNFVYRLDCKCDDCDCGNLHAEKHYIIDKDGLGEIALGNILAVTYPTGEKVRHYTPVSKYRIRMINEAFEIPDYINVFRRYKEPMQEFDVDILDDMRSAMIEFVVYQMRDAITNMGRRETRDATLSAYNAEIEKLNSKYPKFAYGNYGFGGKDG